MSVDAVVGPASVELDAAVAAVRAQRTIFARLAPTQKASLLRACIVATVQCAQMWVIKACQFKQVQPTAAVAGEEWLSGPYTTVRYLRLLAESMAAVARDGHPPLGKRVRRTPSGRLEVILLPTSVLDRAMFWRFEGSAVLQAGLSPEEARVRQAPFY